MAGPEALARAVDLLAAGAWQQAHEIVQQDETPMAAWLHGIVHTLEGDLDNARYWYRRAARVFPGPEAVQQEIAAARADLVTRARDGRLQLPDLEEGTFTISNLGMYGIEQFIAVLKPLGLVEVCRTGVAALGRGSEGM